MNDLKIFENPEFGSIRTVTINDEPWFVGKDVAVALGYEKPTDAVRKHVESEDRGISKMETPSGTQAMTIINESGLYSLILSSKLPRAKEFKRWVTSEVLPSIRKHGAYMTPETLEAAILNPDVMIRLCQTLKAEQEKTRQMAKKIEQDEPKVLLADSITASEECILVGDLAKFLKQNGVDVGQNRLFTWLRDNNYLMKTKGSYNMPTQYAMERGLFEIEERIITRPNGSQIIAKTPKVTGKGQQYFVNLFLKRKNKDSNLTHLPLRAVAD